MRSAAAGAIVDQQDAAVQPGLGRRRGERIADAEIARGSGAGAQFVGHRLQPHEAAHAREQRDVVDRLGQEVVGAGIEALAAGRSAGRAR